MTQTIIAIPAPDGSRTPYHTRVTLICEGDHGGLLQPPSWTRDGGDYIETRRLATEAGWKRGQAGTWLCPECGR